MAKINVRPQNLHILGKEERQTSLNLYSLPVYIPTPSVIRNNLLVYVLLYFIADILCTVKLLQICLPCCHHLNNMYFVKIG